MIELLILLQIKHFLADYPLQYPFHYLNKGTYGHPGGVHHALVHGTLTLAILLLLAPIGLLMAIGIALAETIAHYHIDWAKVKINNFYGWKSHTSEKFWTLLGFDQLLHQLCYLAIVAYIY